MTREQRLGRVFVELADTLVDDFDVIDLMHLLCERSVELLDADAAGLILADQHGLLQVMASTTEEARLLELFVLQNEEGPCLDCYTTGQQITNVDLGEFGQRWPRFHAAATAAGFHSTHALPLRLRGRVIGALNLFCARRYDAEPRRTSSSGRRCATSPPSPCCRSAPSAPARSSPSSCRAP